MFLPRREDYKCVENFKLYELTSCIAFELGIRNKKVKSLLFNYYKNLPYHESCTEHEEYEEELADKYFFNTFTLRYVSESIGYHQYPVEIWIYVNTIRSDEAKLKAFEDLGYKQQFEIAKTYIDSCKISKATLSEEEDKKVEAMFSHLEFIIYSMDNKQVKRYITSVRSITRSYLPTTYLGRGVVPVKIKGSAPVFIPEVCEVKFRSDTMTFSRPKLTAPAQISLEVELPLNLSMPKKEILAYVEALKDKFDKDNQVLCTPIDEILIILDKKLTKKDIANIKCMSAIDWADALYMYDFSRLCTKGREYVYEEIAEEISRYRGYKKKGQSGKTISYAAYHILEEKCRPKINNYYGKTTIKERIKLMKYLIEDCGYRKLITPIDPSKQIKSERV